MTLNTPANMRPVFGFSSFIFYLYLYLLTNSLTLLVYQLCFCKQSSASSNLQLIKVYSSKQQ